MTLQGSQVVILSPMYVCENLLLYPIYTLTLGLNVVVSLVTGLLSMRGGGHIVALPHLQRQRRCTSEEQLLASHCGTCDAGVCACTNLMIGIN